MKENSFSFENQAYETLLNSTKTYTDLPEVYHYVIKFRKYFDNMLYNIFKKIILFCDKSKVVKKICIF